MIELVAPCHFGTEAVLKREISRLGFVIIKTEDGKVTFRALPEDIARCNINLRTAERVLLKIGEFEAHTFDELFEGIKALPWEKYIPKDGKFWVKKASSVNSGLFSPSDIQSIVKKAVVERLKTTYHIDWFAEDGAQYPIRIFIRKDIVLVTVDTTGVSLHKRGYRPAVSKAPISESLAAALLMLTPWHKDRILTDPFCGSGTFPIEAAMISADIAPGMNREFISMEWTGLVPKDVWDKEIESAKKKVDLSVKTRIFAYDIDEDVIQIAKENAARAGVLDLICFKVQDIKDLSSTEKYGFIVTNPPYGERLEERENLFDLYKTFGESFKKLDSWSAFFITSYEDAQESFGMKATKNRKIYNGMIKTYFYQYMGAKPDKTKNVFAK